MLDTMVYVRHHGLYVRHHDLYVRHHGTFSSDCDVAGFLIQALCVR